MSHHPHFDDRDADEHPAFERLCSYQAGELAPPEEEAVREHLAGCVECVGVVLELAGLGDDATEAPAELSEMDVARAWRRVRSRLRDDGAVAAPRRRLPSRGGLLALAAVVVLALALPFVVRQEARLEVRLEPTTATRGAEEPQPCTALSAAGRFQLLLRLRETGELYPSYRLEVRSAAEGLLWKRAAEPTDAGYAVELDGTELPAGRYRLFLVGEGGDEPALLEQYCAQIGAATP